MPIYMKGLLRKYKHHGRTPFHSWNCRFTVKDTP